MAIISGEESFVFPASFAQQRLWFLEQLEPNSVLYTMPTAFRLRGRLDLQALERSLNELVRRHESLRTTFKSKDGEPFQVVHSTAKPYFVILDLSGFHESLRETEAFHRLDEEAIYPFDLCRGPLLRSVLIRLAEDDHMLLVVMHHIVSDAWSMGVFQRELAALYAALTVGSTSPLEEPSLQYADFAGWQKDRLEGELFEKQMGYWRSQLEGIPPVITWLGSRPRPPVQSFRGITSPVAIPPGATEALRLLSRREGVTLFMSLLAVFQTLLHGHTNQDDLVVGIPVANRTRPELEGLIGFFANILPLRTRLSSHLTFRNLLAQVREVCLDAYARQDTPFEAIVAQLNPQRNLALAPVFQVLFNLQNATQETLALPGIEATCISLNRETSKFDLSLSLTEDVDHLSGSLRCALDLFEPETAAVIASQFRKLLEAAATNPDREIPELLRSAGIDPAGRAQQASQPSLIHKQAPAATLGLIPLRADTAAADLSLIQERMWFLQQLEPESSAFNRPKAWRLRGALDVEILANAVNEIVRRHEILRLAVALAEGKPKPILVPELLLSVPVSDLKELPETDRELEARRVAEDEGRRSFDLTKPPLFRIRLIQLSDEDCILQFTFHHIISDAWSDGVFWRELGTIYDALAGGRSPQLPELPIQYSDFARWQRQSLNEKKFQEHFSFWKEKLSEKAPLVSLPLDRPRPAFITPRGDRQSVTIDPVLTESLKALSRREGVTLFTTLLAAFNTLLFRYTGQEDVLVGSPVAGRTRRELEGLIGPLLRTLVLRTDLSGNPRFRELLSRVRRVTLEALGHQDLPFERLLETLRPERALSHSPIFQVLFNFRNVPTETLSLTGVTTRELSIENRDAFFDIDFDLEERNGALQCVARYQETLFDPDTISGFLRHFRTLLEGIVSAPETRIQDLPLVAAEIERQILEEWQQVRNSPATVICVHHRFEAQAHRTPEAQAVCFEDRWLTYRELNNRANQLAHRLQHVGVRPETRVGLFMQRSPEMIVGILGVLIAGGTYVPLDPAYPKARLAFMVKDAQLTLILTQQALLARLEDQSGQHIPSEAGSPFKMPPSMVVDREGQHCAMESRRPPGSSVCPDNLAYVIYTSGSTGNPKGVMVSHRALARCIENVSSVYGIEARDRVLQFASISFDLSVEEIFTPLTHGATLVLRSESMFDSVQEFLEQCRLLSITVLDLPTAYWHQLASALEPGIPDFPGCLRLVVIGGERALPDRVVLWGKRGPSWVRLVNSYGPTEATITATTCELKPGTAEAPPCGRDPDRATACSRRRLGVG